MSRDQYSFLAITFYACIFTMSTRPFLKSVATRCIVPAAELKQGYRKNVFRYAISKFSKSLYDLKEAFYRKIKVICYIGNCLRTPKHSLIAKQSLSSLWDTERRETRGAAGSTCGQAITEVNFILLKTYNLCFWFALRCRARSSLPSRIYKNRGGAHFAKRIGTDNVWQGKC